MEQFVCVWASFDAGHIDPFRDRCKRFHGHHWTIEVEMVGSYDRAFEQDVAAIADEWRDRDINEMIGMTPNTDTLPPWIIERLGLKYPTIIRVSVSDGQAIGVARREIR